MTSPCRYSVRTITGEKILLNDTKRPVFAAINGKEVPLLSAAQVGRLERTHGRLRIVQHDHETGTRVSGISHQITNSSTFGASEIERAYGPLPAKAYTMFTVKGVARDTATRLAKAVAFASDPESALFAVDLASRLSEGGANRWARHITTALNAGAGPVLVNELSSLFYHRDSAEPAAGITVRDLRSARVAADIVLNGRNAVGHVSYREVTLNTQNIIGRMLAEASHVRAPWVSMPSSVRGSLVSGYKLHVYCRHFGDVSDALQRLAPVVVAE